MALSARQQLLFWGIGLVLLGVFFWLLSGTLFPFLAGAAIAYFLDPVADRLQRLGLSRVLATTVITVGSVLVFVVLVLVAVPTLIAQAQALIEAAPGYIAQLQEFLTRYFPELFEEGSTLRGSLGQVQETVREGGLALLNTVLASSLAVIDYVIILVITPVITFYLLLDWDRLVASVDGWLPREHAPTIRRLARDIDDRLAGFVRGQTLVCLILGTFYAVALGLIGLPFGIVVGSVAGLLSFIPYVGAIIGGVLSIGIALFHFWGDWIWIIATAAVFQFGQFVEGNILSPNLVGRSVGLHPVTLILALSVFGTLFGFAGLLIAVPAAAALGVLFRFGMEKYMASALYTGRLPPEP